MHPLASRVLALLIVASALLVACGSSGSTSGQDDARAATTATSAPSTTAATGPDERPADVRVEVRDGSVVGGPGRFEVELGSRFTVEVVADLEDEVHLHTYDVLAPVAPGEPARLTVEASIPGVHELELETSGLLLANIEVS